MSKDILLLRAQSAITNVNDTFPKGRNVKDYENVKLVNLSSCTAAQLPLIIWIVSKNSNFGAGGNVKFFYRSEFYTHEHKSPIWTKKLSSNYLYLNQVDIWNVFLDMIKCVSKSCPSWISGKQAKKWNFLISASNYQRFTKFTSRYMFCGWNMRCD